MTLPNCEPRGTILQWEDWHAHLAGESQGNDFLHEQVGMDDLMFGNLGQRSDHCYRRSKRRFLDCTG